MVFEHTGVAQNTEKNIIEVVGDSARQDAQTLEFGRLYQFLLVLAPVVDVHAAADVARESTIGLESRNAVVKKPAVLAVVAAQPVLRAERPPGVVGGRVDMQAEVEVFRMNSFEPTLAQLLIESAPREIEPGLVDVIETPIVSGRPDQDGSGIRHGAEALFTLLQFGLGLLALGDVAKYQDDAYHFIAGVPDGRAAVVDGRFLPGFRNKISMVGQADDLSCLKHFADRISDWLPRCGVENWKDRLDGLAFSQRLRPASQTLRYRIHQG